MARQARVRSSVGLYHVLLRGAETHPLFQDDEDRRAFVQSLRRAKESGGFSLCAFCLMDNHVHLLLREETDPIEIIIKRIGVSYSYHHKRKFDLSGHLFRDRFRSEPIESKAYFLDVVRYICQNPVKAGLVKRPRDYRWLGCAGVRDGFHLADDLSDFTSLQDKELQRFIREPCETGHLDTAEQQKRLTDREAIVAVSRACGCSQPRQIGTWRIEKQEEAIQKALSTNASIRQLSRITGVTKAVIERIRRNKE